MVTATVYITPLIYFPAVVIAAAIPPQSLMSLIDLLSDTCHLIDDSHSVIDVWHVWHQQPTAVHHIMDPIQSVCVGSCWCCGNKEHCV